MTKREIRERLFNTYAANLKDVHPHAKDLFVCPICHTAFERDALNHQPPLIALAHCIPRSLRGKRLTLACASCDNRAGRQLENHLKTRFESEDFFKGTSPESRRINLTIDDYTVRADHYIRVREDGQIAHDIHIAGKHSNPTSVAALQAGARDGRIDSAKRHISFDDTWFDPRAAQIALLRSGFLIMFKYFGYGYALHPNLRNTKLQILNPHKEIIPGRPAVTIMSADVPPNKIGIVTSPKELRSFFVTMQFRTVADTRTQMAVMLPGIDNDGASIYERIAADQESRGTVNMSMKVISPEENDLCEPGSAYKAWYFWHEVFPTVQKQNPDA